ncbi:MAG TPA: DUF1786 family protein [Thermoleophilia bacterium]|nr:DUF1786 family protein [Thermoleophilia bacterium]
MIAPAQPAGVLAVDVGAGTSDILLTRPGQQLENAVKLVVPSATQVAGARIAAASALGQTVVFRGPVMGGGAVTMAMKAHLAAGHAFVATASAAASFADDPEKARALGVRVVGDEAADEVLRRLPPGAGAEVASGDLDAAALTAALRLLGVEPAFSAVAIAVQDHGFAPGGSNRVLRFSLWQQAVAERRPIASLFYAADSVPDVLTRLKAAGVAAAALAGDAPALVADTGPAALYGALPDGVLDAVLVNIGNGHTVCLLALDGRVAGVFEHHTSCLDGPGLELRLRRWLAGDLESDEVRADHGHGAVLAPGAADRDPLHLPLVVTGPRRELLAGSELPLEFAAPHGDMMLTGCFGLLRALRERHDGLARSAA